MDIREIEKKLKAPFPAEDLEWRIQRSGVQKTGKPWAFVLAYITARAVQDRLDETVGMENWKVDYDFVPKGVVCRLSLRLNGEWITKEDGAEETDVEAFKGGISGALKRSAVLFGIGRYLYLLESNFATITEKSSNTFQGTAKDSEGKPVFFNWLPPELPAWALPSKEVETKIVEEKAKEQVAKLAQRKDAETPKDAGEKPEEVRAATPTVEPKVDRKTKFIEDLKKAKTIEELKDVWGIIMTYLKDMSEADQGELIKLKDKQKVLLSANAAG